MTGTGRRAGAALFFRGALRRWALPAIALAVVAAAYLPSLRNGFVWLDEREILQHGLIVDRLGEIPGLFLNDRNYAGYHRPIYDLLHSLDAAIWGFRPFGFHLSSLVLHLANVFLVWLLVRKAGHGEASSAAIAGLWGLHP